MVVEAEETFRIGEPKVGEYVRITSAIEGEVQEVDYPIGLVRIEGRWWRYRTASNGAGAEIALTFIPSPPPKWVRGDVVVCQHYVPTTRDTADAWRAGNGAVIFSDAEIDRAWRKGWLTVLWHNGARWTE